MLFGTFIDPVRAGKGRKMILIINTTDNKEITAHLRDLTEAMGITAEIIEASEFKISHCIGCNYCWLKTPGECTIKDDYGIILKKLIHADQMWLISDTALGFIDHKGKNIYDRMLPIATMYLKFKDKQMRHVPRYDQKTDVGIICLGEFDKDYLEKWNVRATLNFESRSLGIYKANELEEVVSCMS